MAQLTLQEIRYFPSKEHTKQLLSVNFCDTTALQELKLVFGHTDGRWTTDDRQTDGRTDRRWSRNSYLDTVVAIEKFTSPVLWSKSAIFREVYHYIKMHACCWAPRAFIPHISTFKGGIYLCFCSRGSKVISNNRNIKCVLLRKYKHSNFEGWQLLSPLSKNKVIYLFWKC